MSKVSSQSFVIGIGGISGSGKTYYIDKLKERYKNAVSVISFDDYYKPLHEQETDDNGITNFDLPSALYHERFCEDLLKLLQNHPVLHKKYNFENYDAPETVEIVSPAPLIVAEGLFVFDFPQIDKLLNMRIFMEADRALSLERRLQRDTRERGIPEERSLYQWHNHVLPAFNNHIEPHKLRCDLVIENNGPADDNLEMIHQTLHTKADPGILSFLL